MYTKSYVQHLVPNTATPLAAETLTAAIAVHGEFLCVRRCQVKRLLFVVTTGVDADTIVPQVAFKKRTAPGVTSGQVTLGTLVFVDATVAGKVVYKDIEPVVLNPGQALALEHTVLGTDSVLAAGAGFYAFEVEDVPEEAANESNMLLSV